MVKLPQRVINKEGLFCEFGPYSGEATYKYYSDDGRVIYGNYKSMITNTRTFSADTIRLDVTNWKEGLFPGTLFKSFLEILRVKTGQWWIKKFPYGKDYGGPLSTSVINGTDLQLPFSQHGIPMLDIDFGEVVITKDIWKAAVSDLASNKFPPYHKTCLLNAKASLVSNDFPKCVFDISQTIDLSINHFLATKWMRNTDTEFNNIRASWKVDSTDIVKILKDDIPKLFKSSFQIKDKTSMDLIGDFWKNNRNEVLHGKLDKINHTLHEKINAVENLVNWFENILIE
ncbi:MAG: hypothetical protein L3J06_06145 [Cyclobacteriaceae bacterium]|nr:hypothetical protein [Cyclobacteriaceae bacterium]